MIATVLDPNLKKLKILTDDQRQETHDRVKQLLKQVPVSRCEFENESKGPPIKKSRNVTADFLGDDITDGNDGADTINEFKEYLKSKNFGSIDTHEWWKTVRLCAFSKLGQLRKKRYLGIQATSVPSERAFSTAGLTITKHRASLHSSTADQIIFLNKNLKSPNALLR